MTAPAFFYRLTHGIRVTVRPLFVPERSDAARRRFVFAYFVRLENVSEQRAQLLSRRWLVHDNAGEDTVVEGEGVVGEQPVIEPGQVHEYQSFCVLKSRHGYMEGYFHFERADGSEFDAQIPRFLLDAPEGGWEDT